MEIAEIIQSGIEFILGEQERNGSFPSFSLPDPDSHLKKIKCPSVFSTALILHSLHDLGSDPLIAEIRGECFRFLLSQKSGQWTYNYWIREAEEAKTEDFPDDLDDTACALAALYKHDPKIIDGSVLGKFVMTLTLLEEREGGPYRTWLVDKEAVDVWKYVDLAVNANIAYFLSLHNVELEALTEYFEKAIREKNYFSPYYASPYSVIYFLSRFYRGKEKEALGNYLLENRDSEGKWGNTLDTALAVLAGLELGVPVEELRSGARHLKEVSKEKRWEALPFYIGKHPTGSAALTCAYALEALYKFNRTEKNSGKMPETDPAVAIHGKIIDTAEKRCLELPEPLSRQAFIELNETLKKDKKKLRALLPYHFSCSFPPTKKISEKFVFDCCLFNLYGWIAYTIYDDFLDSEGRAEKLPAANIFFRDMTLILDNLLPDNLSFRRLAGKVIEIQEAANAWEVTHCRFNPESELVHLLDGLPNFNGLNQLYQKSLGLVLGPAAMFFYLGYDENSAEIKKLLASFKAFIAARQLNDDAHDWEDDLKKGQVNYVGALVLKKWKEATGETGEHKKLEEILTELQKVFWYEALPEVCELIIAQVEKAKEGMKILGDILIYNRLSSIIEAPADSARQALDEREQALKFLKVYA